MGPHRMGGNGAHDTVGENTGAYNIVLALLCQGGCRVLFLQVYRVWSLVLRFDLCALPYFLRPFPGSDRAGVPGRLVSVGSSLRQSEKSSEQGFGASPVGDAGRSRKRCFSQDFRSERPSGGGLETEVSPPVGKVGRSWKTVVAPPRPDLPVGDWIVFLACCLDTWAGP